MLGAYLQALGQLEGGVHLESHLGVRRALAAADDLARLGPTGSGWARGVRTEVILLAVPWGHRSDIFADL